MKNYTFHHDPGHGWIEVPLSDLRELGIVDQISSFSYLKGDRVFLEEDCDASFFVRKAKDAGWELTYNESYRERTPIRNYPSYNLGTNYDSDAVIAYLYPKATV